MRSSVDPPSAYSSSSSPVRPLRALGDVPPAPADAHARALALEDERHLGAGVLAEADDRVADRSGGQGAAVGAPVCARQLGWGGGDVAGIGDGRRGIAGRRHERERSDGARSANPAGGEHGAPSGRED